MKDKRLLIIFLTVFIDLVGFGIIIPMNPYLAEAFGASPLQVGLLMSVYSLMQFVFSPIWGQLSDRIGRRPVILISLLGAAIAHLAFAFAPSFWALVVARAFAGLFGGNLSTAMAYIADITDEKNRSKGMGMIGAAFGLGFILGPSMGGIFADVGKSLGNYPPFGQSFPAVVAATICFANFLFALKALPESRQPGSASAVRGHRFQRIFQAFGTPVLNVLILLLFLNTFALAHVEATLFLFVQDQFHWTLSQASFGFAYIGVIMVITQGYLIRKFMPKYGERNILVAGLILSALGFGLSALAGGVWLLALGVTALGFGNGLANPSLNGSISLTSGKDVQGNNLGVSQSLSSMARILGPPSGGLLYQRLSPSAPFAMAAVVMLAGLAFAYAIRKRMPEGGKAH
jgi:DHA1 family tetracycline resistance protein-like MFS transporter